jgi:cytochrome c peroxidase
MPIQDPNEMDLSLDEASKKVSLSIDAIAQALASYVRAQMSGNTRYDRFNAGERAALTPEERVGLRVFQGRGNCLMCHVGPNFSDEKVHNTGVAWQAPDGEGGRGRLLDEGAFAVTGKAEDHGAFKTPTVRDVGRTSPYMHDGSMATLEEVVDFYDRGGRPNPYLDKDMQRLDLLDEEKRGLVAFLKVLSTR